MGHDSALKLAFVREKAVIRIFIADDHTMVREGLKRIISESSEMRVVGEADNGNDVLRLCTPDEVDILLLDISMPGPGLLRILKRLTAERSSIRILVLSVNPEDHYAVRALEAGAAGYLTKNHTPEELVHAILRINAGGKYLSPKLTEQMVSVLQSGKTAASHQQLSDREYEILCMLGAGKKTSQIAKDLCISPKTVGTYRNRIMAKLELSTTGELIRYAVENGLIN